MVAQRFPQVSIVHERDVFCWPTVSEAVSYDFIVMSPPFVATTSQINLSVDNPFTIIAIGLDRAIRVENAASAAELDAPLLAVAIGGYQVHAVFKGTGHPPAARTLLVKPVGGEEQDVSIMQSWNACSFKVHGIHADESTQAPERGIPNRHPQIAIACPAWF